MMTANERFMRTKWAAQVCNEHTITHTYIDVQLSVVSAKIQRCKLACCCFLPFRPARNRCVEAFYQRVAPPSPMLFGPLQKTGFGVGSIKTCIARSILRDFTFYPHCVGMPHTLFCGRAIASFSACVCICAVC